MLSRLTFTLLNVNKPVTQKRQLICLRMNLDAFTLQVFFPVQQSPSPNGIFNCLTVLFIVQISWPLLQLAFSLGVMSNCGLQVWNGINPTPRCPSSPSVVGSEKNKKMQCNTEPYTKYWIQQLLNGGKELLKSKIIPCPHSVSVSYCSLHCIAFSLMSCPSNGTPWP